MEQQAAITKRSMREWNKGRQDRRDRKEVLEKNAGELSEVLEASRRKMALLQSWFVLELALKKVIEQGLWQA